MKKIYPKQLDLETTSHCNLKCIGCPFNKPHNQTHMDYDLYTSIIDRSVKEGFPEQGVQYVLFLNGEPFLHPRYGEMVEQILHHKLRGYFTTNGSKWRDDVYDLVFCEENRTAKYIYQVIVSVDGLPWTNSHHLCKTGSITEDVIKHLERLLEKKKETGSKVDIAVKGVRRGQDWEEIETMISYYLKMGVDYVCFADLLWDTSTPGLRVFPCQYSDYMFMQICADGMLTRCSWNPNAKNDPYYSMGWCDTETPLLQLYHNRKWEEFRRRQRAGDFPPPCDTCGFPYTGTGMEGMVKLRDPKLDIGTIYYQRDYLNSFYSLKDPVRKDLDFYLQDWRK